MTEEEWLDGYKRWEKGMDTEAWIRWYDRRVGNLSNNMTEDEHAAWYARQDAKLEAARKSREETEMLEKALEDSMVAEFAGLLEFASPEDITGEVA